MQWLMVAFGGALGAMARFGVMNYIAPIDATRFPIGTLLINVLGSFLMGALYIVIDQRLMLSPEWRLLLMTGFLGAFTTFSTFSLDALLLWNNGLTTTAFAYVLTTVIGCLLGITVAVFLAQKIFSTV